MRVTELHIQGYRTLKDVHWQPGALNIVIGPNASGKSNLLKFLRLVSASARADLNNHVLHEGGMGAILWDGRGEQLYFKSLAGEPDLPQEEYLEYAAFLRRLGTGAGFVVDQETLIGLHRDEAGVMQTETGYLHRTQTGARYQQPLEFKGDASRSPADGFGHRGAAEGRLAPQWGRAGCLNRQV